MEDTEHQIKLALLMHTNSSKVSTDKSPLLTTKEHLNKTCSSSPSSPQAPHSRSGRGRRIHRPVSIGRLCDPNLNLTMSIDVGWREVMRCEGFRSGLIRVYITFAHIDNGQQKCVVGARSVNFLGYWLSENGIQPQELRSSGDEK